MIVDAVILAGGRGSRMGGRNKGLLPLHGRPLAAHVRDALLRQTVPVREIVVSANRDAAAYAAIGRVVPDRFPDLPGPLAGIHAALMQSDADALLVVGCDMPDLPEDLLARLLQAAGTRGLAHASESGRHVAVCLVPKDQINVIGQRLAAGARRLFDWLQAEEAGAAGFPAGSFVNMNTPDDLARAEGGLTHFNAEGQAHMVDVGHKHETRRVAVAGGRIRMQPGTLALIREGGHKKGDVLGVARIAGIMAAKETSRLIPLCHPLPLTHLDIEFDTSADDAVSVTVTAETLGRTGVEMEALTAVNIALLTIYDMCKAVDRGMVMEGICLLEKQGGKSGHWVRGATG